MGFDWLNDRIANTYSQFGEDGIFEMIFSIIHPANRWCLEVGAHDGIFMSNVRKLIVEQNWHGVMIEEDQTTFQRLQQNIAPFADRVDAICGRVDAKNTLDSLLERCGAPHDIDLVIIDVDGQDYYLFNSMLRYRPRVVMVEFDPNADLDFIPGLDGPGQAGQRAIRRLAAGKFYTLVHRNWCNCIFVKQPLDRLLEGHETAS